MAERKMARLLLSRPADKSLSAYKEWIEKFYQELGGKDDDTLTEKEWEAAWKEFWGNR